MYCVIVGDIIHSKSLEKEKRYESTIAINEVLDRINIKYEKNMLASFGIVRGDGFEGVLFSQQYAPQIIQDIIKALYLEGIRVRISAVMDDLTIVSSNRNKADGQAFYTALEMIEEIRGNKSDHWFQVSIQTNSIAQPLIDSLMKLLEALTLEWTEKQTEIVWNMLECSNQQSLVAKRLNIVTSVINKQLKAARYEAYINAWRNLENYLISYDEAAVNPIKLTPDYTTYYSIGIRKKELQEYKQSVSYLLNSLEIAKKNFGENSPNLVPIYNGLAESYLEQSASAKISSIEKKEFQNRAEKVILKSFECQKTLPKTREQYAQTLNIYGNYYLKIRKYDEALECYLEAKKLVEDILGLDSPHLSVVINNIAIIYCQKEKYDIALEFYYKALELTEKTKKREPINYANELYNIGLCYELQGEHDKALEKFQHALDILLSVLPVKSESVKKVQDAIKKITDS